MPDFAYAYLKKINHFEDLHKIFRQTIAFVKDGFYPKHIYGNTLR